MRFYDLVTLGVAMLLGRRPVKAGGRLQDIRALARDPNGAAGRDHDVYLYGVPRR